VVRATRKQGDPPDRELAWRLRARHGVSSSRRGNRSASCPSPGPSSR